MAQGKSRSGKSLLIDILCDLVTSVYFLKSCSDKALFGNSDEVNEHDFLYVIEYQASSNGNETIKESFKLLTENKDATNDSKGNKERIYGGITILSTGADENRRIQNMDVEVSGRFIILKMSSDPEKTRQITEIQDAIDSGTLPDINFSGPRYERLKSHFAEVVANRTTSFEDPFAHGFAEYLPNTQKSVYYRTLYKSLMKGSALFDHPNRIKADDKILLNVADIYMVYELYHQQYCDQLAELSEASYQSLEKSTSDPDAKRKLQDDHRHEVDMINQSRSANVEWQDVWNKAYSHMEERHPELLREWVSMQSREGKVVVYDPVRKRDVYLCDVKPAPVALEASLNESE
jgi:hypothetical protein